MASWRPRMHWTDYDMAREARLDRWADNQSVYNEHTRRFESEDIAAEPPPLRVRMIQCAGCGTERADNNLSCDCCGFTVYRCDNPEASWIADQDAA